MRIPKGYVRVKGSRRTQIPGAFKSHLWKANDSLEVSISIRRPPGAPRVPTTDDWAKTPPSKRSFLNRREFAERFGATREDLHTVTRFARNNGLKVRRANASERLVVVSGRTTQINSAFGTELALFKLKGGFNYRSYDGWLHLPGLVAKVVDGVFGLESSERSSRSPMDKISSAGPGLTAREIAKLYNFPHISAKGQTIGIAQFGEGIKREDINLYFKGSNRIRSPPGKGLVRPDLHVVRQRTGRMTGEPDSEPAMDVEIASTVGQGARIALYFVDSSEKGWIDLLAMTVAGTRLPSSWSPPSVLSISWGFRELDGSPKAGTLRDRISPLNFGALENRLAEAAIVGMTVFASSGDYGSAAILPSCGYANVNWPASDEWVTACGGTEIKATEPRIIEGAWNDITLVTGGGISYITPRRSWQRGFGMPRSLNLDHRVGRGLPDISGNAASRHPYLLVVGGKVGCYDGTSAVAPLYAGLVAMVNAVRKKPVGYLTSYLYRISARKHSKVFVDVDNGNSLTNGCGGQSGYPCGPGWDACTGLGRIDGRELLAAL